MSDFDSNPFADPDLNNPFKVRLGVGGEQCAAVNLIQCRGRERDGCASPPTSLPRGRSLVRKVRKGPRCGVALASEGAADTGSQASGGKAGWALTRFRA